MPHASVCITRLRRRARSPGGSCRSRCGSPRTRRAWRRLARAPVRGAWPAWRAAPLRPTAGFRTSPPPAAHPARARPPARWGCVGGRGLAQGRPATPPQPPVPSHPLPGSCEGAAPAQPSELRRTEPSRERAWNAAFSAARGVALPSISGARLSAASTADRASSIRPSHRSASLREPSASTCMGTRQPCAGQTCHTLTAPLLSHALPGSCEGAAPAQPSELRRTEPSHERAWIAALSAALSVALPSTCGAPPSAASKSDRVASSRPLRRSASLREPSASTCMGVRP